MDETEVKFVCEDLHACRVCLATDVRLEALYPGRLAETYEQLTGTTVSPTDGLPRHLCTMCAALLKKSAAFRHKCRNTHDFLQRVCSRLQPMANAEITMSLIRNLDTKHLKLPYLKTNTLTVTILGDITNVSQKEAQLKQETHTKLKEETEEDCILIEEFDESPHCDISDEEQVEPSKKEKILTNIIITEARNPIANNDRVSKRRNHVTPSKNDEKIKEYLIKSKTETCDSYKRLFYNHLLDKYFFMTKECSRADVYDMFDTDAETDTTIKTDFDRSVITDNDNDVTDNVGLNKKFFDYVRDKYVNKAEAKKKKKVVDISRVRVGKLKCDRNVKAKEDAEDFGEKYNFDVIRMTINEQIQELEHTRKKSLSYQHATLKCEECFRGFKSETTYKNHMAEHDPMSGSHVCKVCRHRFSTLRKLNMHSQQHRMKYVCRQCQQTFKSSVFAKEHHKSHSGVSYECQHCGAQFRKYASRVNHIRIHHGATTCDICYEGFQGANGLTQHKTKAHKQAYQCASCDVHFDNALAMIKHIGSSPDGACDPNIRACAKCGELCASAEQFDEHVARAHVGRPRPPRGRPARNGSDKGNYSTGKIRTHRKCCICPHFESGATGDDVHNVPKYNVPNRGSCPCGNGEDDCLCPLGSARSCRVVDRRPSTESGVLPKLKWAHKGCCHERRLYKSQVMCEMCASTFQTKVALRTHQLLHTGEKPFQCSVCSKRFRIKTYLQLHMNTHTGERPFKCSLCPKTFKTQTSRYRHRLVHTKERPYSCEVCGKTFQTNSGVKLHVRTVHMKIPPPRRVRNRKRKIECTDSE